MRTYSHMHPLNADILKRIEHYSFRIDVVWLEELGTDIIVRVAQITAEENSGRGWRLGYLVELSLEIIHPALESRMQGLVSWRNGRSCWLGLAGDSHSTASAFSCVPRNPCSAQAKASILISRDYCVAKGPV